MKFMVTIGEKIIDRRICRSKWGAKLHTAAGGGGGAEWG